MKHYTKKLTLKTVSEVKRQIAACRLSKTHYVVRGRVKSLSKVHDKYNVHVNNAVESMKQRKLWNGWKCCSACSFGDYLTDYPIFNVPYLYNDFKLCDVPKLKTIGVKIDHWDVYIY